MKITKQPADSSNVPASKSGAQYGGLVAVRVDPLVLENTSSLTEVGFSDAELEACIKVAGILGENPNLFKLSQLRPLRQALAPLVQLQLQTGSYSTSDSGRTSKRKSDRQGDRGGNNRRTKTPRASSPTSRIKELEKEYINQTQLRAIRLAQLEKLNEQQDQVVTFDSVDSSMGQLVYRVPDGVGSSAVKNSIYNQVQPLLTDGVSSHVIAEQEEDEKREVIELQNPLSCYICRKPYRKLHFFYAQLCPDCASFNYKKRDEITDLRGKVCLVTGARAKIGYRCALKLLRCGAIVIATTRFPVAATSTFLAESDSSDWRSRIHVFGLDFRNITVLEKFCHFVDYTYARLDAIVNNACQTVRRPPAYYTHMMEAERTPWNELNPHAQSMLAPYRLFLGHVTHDESQAQSREQPSPGNEDGDTAHRSSPVEPSSGNSTASSSDFADISFAVSVAGTKALVANPHNISLPSQLSLSSANFFSSSEESQLALLASDADHSRDGQFFPQGYKDVNGQQVDLRRENSWTMRLHQVSTSELAEVMAINAMAPAVLNARLKSLMERTTRVKGRGANGMPINASSEDEVEWKFVVNVSAMEGKFYRYKTKNHPHTNMAKASLNMMTRTSAADYVTSNIYMTAVDTGWINDEKPLELAFKHEANHNFQTPIDEIDAAARVLDPIIGPLVARARGEMVEPPYGVFLKDFQKCEW